MILNYMETEFKDLRVCLNKKRNMVPGTKEDAHRIAYAAHCLSVLHRLLFLTS